MREARLVSDGGLAREFTVDVPLRRIDRGVGSPRMGDRVDAFGVIVLSSRSSHIGFPLVIPDER